MKIVNNNKSVSSKGDRNKELPQQRDVDSGMISTIYLKVKKDAESLVQEVLERMIQTLLMVNLLVKK